MRKLLLTITTTVCLSFGGSIVGSIQSEANPRQGYERSYQHNSKVKKTKKKVKKVKHSQQTVNIRDWGDESNSATFFNNERIRSTNTVRSLNHVLGYTETATKFSLSLSNQASVYMGATAAQLGLPNRLWCADFMNMLVGGTDRRAISYASRGRPASYGCIDCIVVTKRRGGYHVGIIKGYDSKGNLIVISGNHNRRVAVGYYSPSRVVAFRYV